MTNQYVLMRNTDTYGFMLIYHQMPSLSASLDQIQEIWKIDIFFLYLCIYSFIYLFIENKKLLANKITFYIV